MDDGLCQHGNYHCLICENQMLKQVIKEIQDEKISKHFGWFEGNGNEPTHDPKDVPCLICYKPWTSNDVITLSLMKPGDNRSYFYRVHKTCYTGLSEDEKQALDSSLIDDLM